MAGTKKAPATRRGHTKEEYERAGKKARAEVEAAGGRVRRAALYIRVSTHHQLDRDSLPYQRKELTNYAKYVLGIDDVEIFEDAGYSGKDVDRPAYQKMMKGVRAGYFTHILVWKIDRISRNLLDFAAMYEELKKYDVVFISKNEQFDTGSAMGEAMLKIILVFAELERQLTAERVTAIMYSRAEKGLWNGAPIPIGYMWSEEHKYPVINPDEAPTVRLIFDKYEEMKSSASVRDYLNKNRIYTKRGNEWNTTTVTKVLRNPFYKGTYRYNYRTATGTLKPIAEQIIHHNNHDAIITEEQWQRCNDIMDKNAKRSVSQFVRSVKYTHVFANLIKCGVCGDTMGAKMDKRRGDGYQPSLYRCISHNTRRGCTNKSISDVVLGPFVFNYISNLLTAQKKIQDGGCGPEELERILLRGNVFKDIVGLDHDGLEATFASFMYEQPGAADRLPAESGELAELQKEKEKYERAFDRLQNLYLFSDESMSEKDYLVKKKDIADHIDAINEQIRAIHEKHNEVVDLRASDFTETASYFYLYAEVTRDRRYILDYKKLVTTFEKQLLKDFINTVLRKIVVQDGRIAAVTFRNGLTHKFIYK